MQRAPSVHQRVGEEPRSASSCTTASTYAQRDGWLSKARELRAAVIPGSSAMTCDFKSSVSSSLHLPGSSRKTSGREVTATLRRRGEAKKASGMLLGLIFARGVRRCEKFFVRSCQASWRVTSAHGAHLRGKIRASPVQRVLPPSQRASLRCSMARPLRRSLVHTDAEVPCGSVYSTDNSVLRRAG